jgi:hypothetical protein
MAHIVIIIDAKSPPPPADAAVLDEPAHCHVSVSYRPAHDLTAAQIGAEVARITRKAEQIIAGSGGD